MPSFQYSRLSLKKKKAEYHSKIEVTPPAASPQGFTRRPKVK